MREVLTRRALDFDKIPPPDLWLIDGERFCLIWLKIIVSSGQMSIF